MKTTMIGALALFVAAVAVAAPTANAKHFCNGNGTVVNVGDAAYVTVDEVLGPDSYLFSIWLYAETNGQQDLQRGGTTLTFGSADICQDSATPDTAIW